MKAYKTSATIQDSKRVVLNNVPFDTGQRVEVLLLALDQDETDRALRLKALFKETQGLPQIRTITEDEIAVEIVRYRSGQ